jgi:hypothetical protein
VLDKRVLRVSIGDHASPYGLDVAPGYFVNICASVAYLVNIVHFFCNQGTGVVDKMREVSL